MGLQRRSTLVIEAETGDFHQDSRWQLGYHVLALYPPKESQDGHLERRTDRRHKQPAGPGH